MRYKLTCRREQSTVALTLIMLCAITEQALGQVTPVSPSGVPQQIIPSIPEQGAPPFVALGRSSSAGGGAGSTGTDDSALLGGMTSQSWGEQAAAEAQALGVSPIALAATCMVESGCSADAGSSGTISGAFQMRDDTYEQMIQEAEARDPALAATIPAGLAGKNDPAVQAVAAAQYLYDGAKALQAAGIEGPTVLATRALYQFGTSGGKSVATADAGDLISTHVSLSAQQYAANGIDPATTTVGEWRQSVIDKLGVAAASTVLV